MKYISTNIFSDFEFHDSYFKLESFKDDVLTVSGAWDEETVYTKVKAFLWDGNQSPYESELEIAVK